MIHPQRLDGFVVVEHPWVLAHIRHRGALCGVYYQNARQQVTRLAGYVGRKLQWRPARAPPRQCVHTAHGRVHGSCAASHDAAHKQRGDLRNPRFRLLHWRGRDGGNAFECNAPLVDSRTGSPRKCAYCTGSDVQDAQMCTYRELAV
jgi:hypothetical protein